MNIAPKPKDEANRLAALRDYQLLDTPFEKEYDELVALASAICETPISTITLIDDSRQWHKAFIGPVDQEANRDFAFCAHAILQDGMMVVADASKDERFSDNPFVTGHPNIRFYAGMPLINPQGYKLGTLCVIDPSPKELTETQRLALQVLSRQVVKQMELRKKMTEVQRMNETNNKLLSIISHDLRSPMVSLYGLLELVEKHDLSVNEFKEFIPKVRAGFNSASDLLSNLLSWTTSQFSNANPRKETFFLHDVANEIIVNSQFDISQKENLVINHVDRQLSLFTDVNMIKAVIRNLVLNANKFTAKGTIDISAKLITDKVEVCIEDTGVGMEPEQLDTLFSWGTKKSTPGTSGEQGSGFGLLVCKDFVEKVGGSMWATSALGKGSAFYFSIPISLK
jgi:Signal transduction histidine kinase